METTTQEQQVEQDRCAQCDGYIIDDCYTMRDELNGKVSKICDICNQL